jgi:vesicle transport through interaction with t-SNAREs protein 1
VNTGTAFNQRDDLMNDSQVRSIKQREDILVSNQRLSQTDGRISNAIRIGEESEAIGAGVLGELGKQRGQLESAVNKVQNINDEMSRSKRIMLGIQRRLITDKLLLSIIIVVLVILIGLVVYLKWGSWIVSKIKGD